MANLRSSTVSVVFAVLGLVGCTNGPDEPLRTPPEVTEVGRADLGFSVRGAGAARSCAQVLEAAAGERIDEYQYAVLSAVDDAWIAGFVSGMSAERGGDAFGRESSEKIEVRVELECEANQELSLAEAVVAAAVTYRRENAAPQTHAN